MIREKLNPSVALRTENLAMSLRDLIGINFFFEDLVGAVSLILITKPDDNIESKMPKINSGWYDSIIPKWKLFLNKTGIAARIEPKVVAKASAIPIELKTAVLSFVFVLSAIKPPTVGCPAPPPSAREPIPCAKANKKKSDEGRRV